MCRSLPPGMLFSVSPIEKADAQILYVRVRDVPTGVIQGKWGTVVKPNYLLAHKRTLVLSPRKAHLLDPGMNVTGLNKSYSTVFSIDTIPSFLAVWL